MKPQSPSQRLRSVIFLLWENTDRKLDFDTYYLKIMESIIEQMKGKL